MPVDVPQGSGSSLQTQGRSPLPEPPLTLAAAPAAAVLALAGPGAGAGVTWGAREGERDQPGARSQAGVSRDRTGHLPAAHVQSWGSIARLGSA